MLILWKLGLFTLNISFRGEWFICIVLDWKRDCYFIINVYSSLLLNKRKLWTELKDFKYRYLVEEWYIGMTLMLSRSQVNISEILEFIQLIEKLYLMDVPSMQGRYTLLNLDGSAMNRLDRFLMSEGLIEDGMW